MKASTKKHKQTVAVCGIGYVGYAVSLLFANAGFNVISVDIDEDKVGRVNSGESIIKGKEPGLCRLTKEVGKGGNLRATTDTSDYSLANYILVMVQTPVGEESKSPTYTHLKSALKEIGSNMKKGVTVVIESTIAPGTCNQVVVPTLERNSDFVCGKDFYLAHCPERLMPGHMIENVTEYNRVIGGFDEKSAQKAKELYQHIVKADLDITSCTTAEVVKTTENTYRDVQIAFANEIALICEAFDANVWEVREYVNKCKKKKDTRPEALRQMHYPGSGVGGHCIPKDPWLLISGIRNKVAPRIIPGARKINDSMPLHMVELLEDARRETGKQAEKLKVVVLSYAYDANSDDIRNTPTEPLINELRARGIGFEIHDPYVSPYNRIPLEKLIADSDAIIIMKAHDEYRKHPLSKLKSLMTRDKPIIIDGANVYEKREAVNAGFLYKGVGNI